MKTLREVWDVLIDMEIKCDNFIEDLTYFIAIKIRPGVVETYNF